MSGKNGDWISSRIFSGICSRNSDCVSTCHGEGFLTGSCLNSFGSSSCKCFSYSKEVFGNMTEEHVQRCKSGKCCKWDLASNYTHGKFGLKICHPNLDEHKKCLSDCERAHSTEITGICHNSLCLCFSFDAKCVFESKFNY